MKRTVLVGSICLASASLAGPAHAVDAVFVEAGTGDSTDMARVGAKWNWLKGKLGGLTWEALVEAEIGYWEGRGSGSITEVGLTPVFRLHSGKAAGLRPYLEGAIGVHFLSRTRINRDREFGTAFQFGDHIGLGVQFGERHQYDLGYRFQHISNGSIKQPNDGINFNQLHFSCAF